MTLKGKKEHNEDFARINSEKGIYILADGFPGQEKDAAKFAVESLYNKLNSYFPYKGESGIDRLAHDSMEEVNWEVYKESIKRNNPNGMSMTLDLALIRGEWMHLYHIGDASVYLSGDEFKKLTRDDRQLQDSVDLGRRSPDEVKFLKPNKITNRFGKEGSIDYSIIHEKLQKGDRVLMTTDGLTDVVTESRIEYVLRNQDTRKVLYSLAKSYIYIDQEVVDNFFNYGNEFLDWFDDKNFEYIFKDFYDGGKYENKLMELKESMKGLMQPDSIQKVINDYFKDKKAKKILEEATKNYLSEMDNCTMIFIEKTS